MTRKQALAAIKAAGASGDQKAFLRLYVENRVALHAAQEAFEEGKRFAAWIKTRDSKA
jgi:hypothetical protein